jgi:protease I
VVEEGNIITSRKPDDIPAFSKKLTEVVAKSPQHAHAH